MEQCKSINSTWLPKSAWNKLRNADQYVPIFSSSWILKRKQWEGRTAVMDYFHSLINQYFSGSHKATVLNQVCLWTIVGSHLNIPSYRAGRSMPVGDVMLCSVVKDFPAESNMWEAVLSISDLLSLYHSLWRLTSTLCAIYNWIIHASRFLYNNRLGDNHGVWKSA